MKLDLLKDPLGEKIDSEEVDRFLKHAEHVVKKLNALDTINKRRKIAGLQPHKSMTVFRIYFSIQKHEKDE